MLWEGDVMQNLLFVFSSRTRYQMSVYRSIGHLVLTLGLPVIASPKLGTTSTIVYDSGMQWPGGRNRYM